jgi:glycosyltransferase involved in cell wall biosynthesis
MEYPNLISIIIPLDSAVTDEIIGIFMESILAQNYQPIETIVIDGRGKKKNLQLQNKIPSEIQYIARNYTDISTAYNVGIKLAQGEFLAFIDLENLWLPDKLTIQMAALENHPQLDGVFGYIHEQPLAQADEYSTGAFEELSCESKNIPGYIPSTLLIRHEAWKRVGKFSESFLAWYELATKQQLDMLMLPIIVAKRWINLTKSDRLPHSYSSLSPATTNRTNRV